VEPEGADDARGGLTAFRPPRRFGAVLFDWRGTLVHDPDHAWWITRALQSLGRPVHGDELTALVDRVRQAESLPEHREDEGRIDTSSGFHREASLRLFAAAGLDAELAEALFVLDFDPASHPLYPDVVDVLTILRSRAVKIALVSDVHFDLRAEFAALGIAQFFEAFVLSYEHGIQKPDPRMFELALEALSVDPADALMVGDRASHDGGAAAVGIATLILPMPAAWADHHLGPVLDLVGG
jgi:HAD superfamily hydrolase (TIGR01509 family)